MDFWDVRFSGCRPLLIRSHLIVQGSLPSLFDTPTAKRALDS